MKVPSQLGLSPALGTLIAERISGVDSVAHVLAFCQAVEIASQCEVPERARYLRTIMAELERLYNHLHYLGHLCHTTTLKVGEAQGKLLAEQCKQLNGVFTGSRFLRGLLKPGGLRRESRPACARRASAGIGTRYRGLYGSSRKHE